MFSVYYVGDSRTPRIACFSALELSDHVVLCSILSSTTKRTPVDFDNRPVRSVLFRAGRDGGLRCRHCARGTDLAIYYGLHKSHFSYMPQEHDDDPVSGLYMHLPWCSGPSRIVPIYIAVNSVSARLAGDRTTWGRATRAWRKRLASSKPSLLPSPTMPTTSNTCVREVLELAAMVPEANPGKGDCFWQALERVVGVDALAAHRQVAQWLSQRPLHEARDQNESLTQKERYVQAAIEAWRRFPYGLLILHAPSATLTRFHAHHRPKVIHLLELLVAPAILRSAPSLLYTEPQGATQPGRFERLQALTEVLASASMQSYCDQPVAGSLVPGDATADPVSVGANPHGSVPIRNGGTQGGPSVQEQNLVTFRTLRSYPEEHAVSYACHLLSSGPERTVPTPMPANHLLAACPLERRNKLASIASLPEAKSTEPELSQVILRSLYLKLAAVASPPREHLPCDWASTFLFATGLRRVANEVTSHCFWHAQQHLTGMPVAQAMRTVHQASGLDVATPSTCTSQISIIVQSLPGCYANGLLILHAPSAGAFLFRPECAPRFVSLPDHEVLLPITRTAQVMLYMEYNNAALGHFEACLLEPPESSSPITAATLQTTLLETPTSDCSAECCHCVHAACRPTLNGGATLSPASIPLTQPSPPSPCSPALASEASFSPERSRSPRARAPCSPTPIATAVTQPCISPEQDIAALELHKCTPQPSSQASAPYASTPLSAHLAERMSRQEIPTQSTVLDSPTSQDFEASQDIGSPPLPSPIAQMRCAEIPASIHSGPSPMLRRAGSPVRHYVNWSPLDRELELHPPCSRLPTTQEVLESFEVDCAVQPAQDASVADSAGHRASSAHETTLPVLQPSVSLEASAARSFALLAHASLAPCQVPPARSCPDPSLLAIRIWQVQKLSPVPVTYSAARAAACNHWDNLNLAIAQAAHCHYSLPSETSDPEMEGGMWTPAATSPRGDLLSRLRRLGIPTGIAEQAEALFGNNVSQAAAWSFEQLELASDSVSPPRRRPRLSPPPAARPTLSPCQQLQRLGLSARVAQEALATYPADVNSAADWALSRVNDSRAAVVSASTAETRPSNRSAAASPRPSVAPSVRCMHASPRPTLTLPALSMPSAVPTSEAPQHLQRVDGDISPVLHEPAPDTCLRLLPTPIDAASLVLQADASPRRASIPRQLRDVFDANPEAEVRAWVVRIAQRAPSATSLQQRLAMWGEVPLYSTYIRQKSLHQVVADTVSGIRARKRQQLSAVQACELTSELACCTFFPLAVAASYVANRGGKPETFVVDMFMACLASCVHRLASLCLYPAADSDFMMRARFWAILTGEPTAGKSPTYSWLLSIFQAFLKENSCHFPWFSTSDVSHIYTRGTHAGFNETLRDTNGVALCTNPEARTVLDPAFPQRLITDDKHYLNLSYLLETASGGSYEWITASDLRKAREAARQIEELEEGRPPTVPVSDFLKFDHTSVNLCYFQQQSVLDSWWVPLETKHGIGFSARILFSFAHRALIDRDLGRGSTQHVDDLFRKFWSGTCAAVGHDQRNISPMLLSPSQEQAFTELYFEVGELCSENGWGSAAMSALGKLEYHVGMMAQLTQLLEHAFQSDPSEQPTAVSDNALKCALRFFDCRLLHGCAVIDYCSADATTSKKRKPAVPPAHHADADTAGRVLRHCTADPITMTEMSRRLAYLRKDADCALRKALLQKIVDLDLGRLEVGARGAVVLWRAPLTDSRRKLLDALAVPLDRYRPASEWPAMNGCGRNPQPSSAPTSSPALLPPQLVPTVASGLPRTVLEGTTTPCPPWVHAGVPFMRLFFQSETRKFTALAHLTEPQAVGQQLQWDSRREVTVLPQPGTYAVVKCAGEHFFRALFTQPATLGLAGGHAGLAAEQPVLFAGEIQLGPNSELQAWTNVTGTYHFPEDLAQQSGLPADAFWAFQPSCNPANSTEAIALPGGHALVRSTHAASGVYANAVLHSPVRLPLLPSQPCAPDMEMGSSQETGQDSNSQAAAVLPVPSQDNVNESDSSSQTPVSGAEKEEHCREEAADADSTDKKPSQEDAAAPLPRPNEAEKVLGKVSIADPGAKREFWQTAEKYLRSKGYNNLRPAVGPSRRKLRLPRFYCLCGGRSKESTKGELVCPVVWTGRVEKATDSDLHELIIAQAGVHEPYASRDAGSRSKLCKARQSRKNFDAHYTTLLLSYQVGAAMTAQQIRAKARGHCQDAEAAHAAGRLPFDITHRPGWQTVRSKDGSICVPLLCSSCKTAEKCTWEGAASYSAPTKVFALRCSGDHDPAGQRKKGGTVTPVQRALLNSSNSCHAMGRLVEVNKLPESPPDARQEQNRRRNGTRRRFQEETAGLRKKLRFEADERTSFTPDDIFDAIRDTDAKWRADLPLRGAVRGALQDDALEPDDLLILSTHTFTRASGKPGCCIVVATKELMQVPLRLSNPDFVKVAVDATFRDIFGDWKLIPLGVLSKHIGSTTLDGGLKANSWCTHCTPVLYCVTNSDSAISCEHLLRAFNEVPLSKIGLLSYANACKVSARRDADPNSPDAVAPAASVASCSHIRQLHVDWAKGLEVARRSMCPNSVRQGDFRHMFREVGDKIPQKLCARGQARRREVRQMLLTSLQITRTQCTTLTEFHLFWTCLFHDLMSAGESDVVEYLRKTYFFHLPVEVARTQYGLTSPIHCAEGILCAAWWGAYCAVFSPVPLPALSRWRCAISIHSVMLSSMKPATSFPTCRPVSFSHTCKKSCKSKGANFANARIRFPTIRVAGTLSLSPLTASPSSVAALPLSFTTRSI